MNRKCMHCGADYLVENSDAFFRFQFCTDSCQNKAETEFVQSERYVCIAPLVVEIVKTKQSVTIQDGSKWKRNDKRSQGLSQVHLESLSGKANELEWIEISNQILEKHFQKIN